MTENDHDQMTTMAKQKKVLFFLKKRELCFRPLFYHCIFAPAIPKRNRCRKLDSLGPGAGLNLTSKSVIYNASESGLQKNNKNYLHIVLEK